MSAYRPSDKILSGRESNNLEDVYILSAVTDYIKWEPNSNRLNVYTFCFAAIGIVINTNEELIKYAYVFALSDFIAVVNSIRQSPLCHEQIYERKNT